MPSIADIFDKKKRIVDFLMDKQARSDMGQGLTDSVNRGAIAGLLGGPVDAVSGVVNAGLMGLGYAGNKLGLLGADRMPQPIQKPVGGSEWIGDLLQRGKMVSENRNAPAEMLAGLLAPSAVRGASKAAFAAEQNAMAPTPYNTAARNQLGATVWHGSPHKFDKFDSSKIGTGEGAQAYGHGLYLAESPEVAGSYAQSVKANSGELVKRGKSHGLPEDVASNLAAALQSGKKFDPVLDSARSMINDPLASSAQKQAAQRLIDNEMAAYNAWSEWSKPGQVYKVDLPDEHIAKMLDWDKPLSQQPSNVKKALKKAGIEVQEKAIGEWPVGEEIYKQVVKHAAKDIPLQQAHDLAMKYGSPSRDPAGASNLLKSLGVPGIRYLDQGSRNTGQGTSNFVVFPGNEGLLKILERNGQAIK